jgi:ribose transport system permease protein
MIISLILQETNSVVLALAAALALGAAVGAFNGFGVTVLKIPAFLVTLGMMSVIRGISMWTTNTKSVPIFNEFFNFTFGAGDIGGIPVLLIWTIIALIIGHIVLTKTAFGRRVMAVGGNSVAAQYSGVNVKKVTMSVFIIMGMIAAFAGALYAGRMQTSRWSYGEGAEMDVIASVVLGGTSMAGGSGSVVGAVIGALLISLINNGLIIGGFQVAQQTVMRGVIIILAVALGNIGKIKR